MPSLLPHELCHGRSASRRPPTKVWRDMRIQTRSWRQDLQRETALVEPWPLIEVTLQGEFWGLKTPTTPSSLLSDLFLGLPIGPTKQNKTLKVPLVYFIQVSHKAKKRRAERYKWKMPPQGSKSTPRIQTNLGTEKPEPPAMTSNCDIWVPREHRRANYISKLCVGTSLGGPVVETSPSIAGGVGSIPGQGTKILHAS